MTRAPLLVTLAAAAALAGCKENHTIVAGGPQEGNETNVATNAQFVLPASIAASKTYRCADNKLLYIDWMSDGTARVKSKADEPGSLVTPGTTLKGDANAGSISYNGQSCKA